MTKRRSMYTTLMVLLLFRLDHWFCQYKGSCYLELTTPKAKDNPVDTGSNEEINNWGAQVSPIL